MNFLVALHAKCCAAGIPAIEEVAELTVKKRDGPFLVRRRYPNM